MGAEIKDNTLAQMAAKIWTRLGSNKIGQRYPSDRPSVNQVFTFL